MEIVNFILNFLKDPAEVLKEFIQVYGIWVYGFLFLVVFVETGVVVMPFLPGDSLLFSIGLISKTTGELNLMVIIPLLIFAALLGDNLNYYVGKTFGDYVQSKERFLFLKKEHIVQTEQYFEENGPKTIILARFIPIVRTVAPFVAGAGEMRYATFFMYSLVGAVLWVISISSIGYILGTVPFVKDHFEHVILSIVFVSILPIIFKLFKKKQLQTNQS